MLELLLGSGFMLVLIIIAMMIFLNFVPIGLWVSAIAANVNVGIFTLVGMRLRRVSFMTAKTGENPFPMKTEHAQSAIADKMAANMMPTSLAQTTVFAELDVQAPMR